MRTHKNATVFYSTGQKYGGTNSHTELSKLRIFVCFGLFVCFFWGGVNDGAFSVYQRIAKM